MKFIKKNLKWLTITMALISLIGGTGMKFYLNRQALVLKNSSEEKLKDLTISESESTEKSTEVLETEEPQKVFIDIKGAVVSPGVYEIEETKKVIDVVNLAGGFTENANTEFINLAKQVKNEMVIIIYTNEEVEKTNQENTIVKVIDKECVCPQIKNDACLTQEETTTNTENTETFTNYPINLNTATKEELETLPGIGSSKAEAILKYREEKGGFETVEEIKEVTGIGESLYEKIKDYITV